MSFNKFSTPFQSLIKIRNTFGGSEINGVDVVNSLITGSNTSVLADQAVGASGLVYKFITSGATRQIQIYQQQNSDLSYQSYIDLAGDITDQVFQDIQSRAATPGAIQINLANVLQDITDGSHFNGVVSELAGSFMDAHKMSLSDISAILNAHNLGSTNDLNSLMKLMIQCAQDGKVNSYAFISIIGKLCSNADSQVSDGHLEMDTSQPLIIQSVLATVKYFSSMILSTILSVLSTALRGIIGAIAGILSSIFSLMSTHVSNTLNIDPDTVSGLVDGPIQYIKDSLGNSYPISTLIPGTAPDFVNNVAYFSRFGMIHNYRWKDGNTYCSNSFVGLDFQFEDFAAAVYSSDDFDFENHKCPLLDLCIGEACDSKFDELLKCMSDPSYATRKLALELAIIASMGLYTVHYSGGKFHHDGISATWGPGSGSTNRVLFQNCFHSSTNTLEKFRSQSFTFVWNMLYRHFYNGSAQFPVEEWLSESDITDEDAMSYIQKFYTAFVPYAAVRPFMTQNAVEDEMKTWGQATFNQLSNPLNSLAVCVYAQDNDTFTGQYWFSNFELSPVDRLPSDRTFSIPEISGSTALKTFVIISAVTIAASAAITLTGKAIKKRKFIRQIKEKDKLTEARANYYNNPSDATLNDFYRAQKSYNFKAKLFGWSGYDATNDWFNDASGSNGSDSNSTNPVTDSVLYKLIKG